MSNRAVVKPPLGQPQERFDIKKGLSRKKASHQNEKNTWWSTCNFRFYKQNIFTFFRKTGYATMVPVSATLDIPSNTCLINTATLPPVPLLTGLLWTLPASDNHFLNPWTPINQWSASCPVNNDSSLVVSGFADDSIYNATIRIRGVMETRSTYTGTFNGTWVVGGDEGTGIDDAFNVYKLSITGVSGLADQVYFVNPSNVKGVSYETGICYIFDFTEVIRISNGCMMDFFASSIDGFEVSNSADNTGTITPPQLFAIDKTSAFPIKVTQPFDGQFAQLDVISVSKI